MRAVSKVRGIAAAGTRERDEAAASAAVKTKSTFREYVEALLSKAQGNVSLAARQAGIDRVYLHRLMKKHGLGG